MPQDYCGQNLRGRSFKGQNLEGANFSDADIRACDFSAAILRSANFSRAKAGLRPFWVIFLASLSLLLLTTSGCLSAIAGVFLLSSFLPEIVNKYTIIPGVILSTILAIFFVTSISRGLGLVSVAMMVAGAIAVAFAALVAAEFPGVGAGAVAFAVAIAGMVAGAILGAVSIAGAIVVTFAKAAAVLVAVTIAVIAAVAFADNAIVPGTVVVTVVVTSLSSYIACRALADDEKYSFVRNIAVSFAATGGTSFQKTDLTDANLTGAVLKSTNFRGANITCTSWFHAQKLDLACFGESYLKNPQLRQLVTSGNGQNQNFDRLDLRNFNLCRANLENASFIDADFHKAKLQGANLSGTKLVRTNLERTNLQGACLTGSCIQDWKISKGTKLDGIVCDYVYLKWDDVKKDKRDQMPPRGKFKEGGFVTFVKYILDTVELYHEKDINPGLALIVLQKMSKDYDEPLNVVALGKRGDKVFIQVKVSESIIQDQFKEDYYSKYDEDLKLWSSNSKQLPPAINNLIEKKLIEITSKGTDDFVFVDVAYVEGNYTEINQGDITMTGDRNIHMGGGNYNERIQRDYVQGNYYAAGQPQSLAQAAAEIQLLLKQLEQTYPTTTISQQMVVAAEAVNRIENNPLLKERVINAVKSGGLAAFEKAIDNPVGAFIAAAIKGWQEVETKD